MAHAQSTRQSVLNSIPLLARLSDTAKELRAGFETHRLYRRTLNELQSLSMREMNDLGLNPSNLHQIAWETAVAEVERLTER